MKRINTIAIATLAVSFIIAGCNNTKSITPSEAGEIEIVELCSGDGYLPDSKHFRASATGTSVQRETAKKIARANAENKLGRSISVTLSALTDNSVTSMSFNNQEEATSVFKEHARSTVKQELRGAITICEKLTQKPDGTYSSYIAIELSGEGIAQAYNERLAKDERIMAEYNYENFKETFEAEMNKLN